MTDDVTGIAILFALFNRFGNKSNFVIINIFVTRN